MDAERIRGFRLALQERSSDRSVPTEHGVARLADDIPDVYDANYLSVEGAAAPAEVLAAEADEVLADRYHRRVIVEGGGVGLVAAFSDLNYQLSTHLVLAHGRAPDRLVDTSRVRAVDLDELIAARTHGILAEPWGDAEIAAQLNAAKYRIRDAVDTTFFAVYDGGRLAGYCELRVRDGVAQIEDVEVLPEFRGRGLGRAVVQRALEAGQDAADVVFLEALADDWPRELYAKLGFLAVDQHDFYTRLPHALTRLRVRTPRLELRLATIAELHRLYAVAAAGIHDPDVMPFGVAWTDDLREDAFVAHHVERVATWSPDDWHLNLIAFLDGAPIGSQALRGERFPDTRRVETGSWLGRAWQGQGLGTEMRAGVLTLAFDGLSAEVATSGYIAGNPQSQAVSRKLGYELVGSHTVAPRGEPVEHADLELRREAFASPVPVELSSLGRLLPLFGAAG